MKDRLDKRTKTTLGALCVAVSLMVCAMFTPVEAHAVDVFLNGVKISGMSNQEFEDAKVRFDPKGNIHITVSGVKVHMMDQPLSGQVSDSATALAKKYWLVCNQNARGMTQYNVDVHINGQFVTRIKEDNPQVVLEITKYLQRGKNTVVFTSIKSIGERRKSFSAEHHVSLLIGEGKKTNAQLTIDKSLIEYKRNASQVENHSATKVFEAR